VSVEIWVLGRFDVRIDARPVPPAAWSRRQAASLVKLLALAARRQLHREQVMDALWPDLPVDEATPRLHKAAHFARRVLGPGAVALHHEIVALFPDVPVSVDAVRFQERAQDALDASDPVAAGAAADLYGGPLLPDDRYEPWAEPSRDRLHLLYLRLLRLARRWSDLIEADPTDAEAHLALMREHVAAGDRRAALRRFERLEKALQGELGVRPSEEALALRDSILDGLTEPAPAGGPSIPIGRDGQMSTLERLLDEARRGRGRTVFLAGAPGLGKSMLATWLRGQAAGRGWRTGHGVASAIEGAWPYAPVLEAIADLCRRHPSLLDGLDDRCRDDIDRALARQSLDWDRDGSHQRLFVAVAELARLAAAGPGVLFTVDDVHEADEASLRLLHYLARSGLTERLVLVLCHRRQPVTDAFDQVRASLLGRGAAVDVALTPLDRADCTTLARSIRPDLDDDGVDQIWAVSGGVPFAVIGLARATGATDLDDRSPGSVVIELLPPPVRTALEPVAITGSTFDTDEFLSLCDRPEEAAYDCLDAALAARVIERTLTGFRFRHPLIRDAVLDAIPPHRRPQLHRLCAERLVAADASPARIGHHLLAAGDTVAAVPYVLRAAETAAAVGAYRDALSLVDSIRKDASGAAAERVLALRADLLATIGDPTAMSAYRGAIAAADPHGQRALRARMARFAILSGDRETAASALVGLEPDGGPEDIAIQLAKANVAYFTGDLEAATAALSTAYRADTPITSEHLDVVTLKSLIAHNRGEWSQLLRLELKRTQHDPAMAMAVFDSHLCVAEYVLYGPTPYDEVTALACNLRETAERAGALRAVGFATVLIGEAALLNGDLDLAERELTDAVDLHRELGGAMGEAHSLQRLAEVHLARGDRATANQLLRRALPLARWSVLAMHLLQRVYGTMVAAAEDADAARAMVDAAEATLGTTDNCSFCSIMFDVPAAIACAGVGDAAEARRHLARAEKSAPLWEGTAWQAATLEARAHVLRAEGDTTGSERCLARAADLFEVSAQPLDVARVRAELRAQVTSGTAPSPPPSRPAPGVRPPPPRRPAP
jgi:DNA-binding SARP family transcriptional activator/tetratricopeptide (TPR) repeat protein